VYFFADGAVHRYNVKTNEWAAPVNVSMPILYDSLWTDLETGVMHGIQLSSSTKPLMVTFNAAENGANYTYSYEAKQSSGNSPNFKATASFVVTAYSSSAKTLFAYTGSQLFKYDVASMTWSSVVKCACARAVID
jgi:hypothetical protein